MKVAIILNGISRKKKFFYQSLLPPLKQKFEVEVFETNYQQHAIGLASAAVSEKFEFVLAAGGDGTLNQILNGVIQSQGETQLPSLGIIPLGTGNDFARMCGIKPDANQIVNLLIKNNPRATDVGKINCYDEHAHERTKYFINVCSIGMGPEVVKRLMNSDRSLGPLITYLKAIASTFFHHNPQEVMAQTSSWKWHGKMRVLAVANGQSFGNSMYIAPDAAPDDGQFATFVAGDISLMKFLFLLQKIKGKKKISDPKIFYDTCTSANITAVEPCPVEAEGEWMGWLPLKIEMLPGRIKFLR